MAMCIGVILGKYCGKIGLYRDNGKENGKYTLNPKTLNLAAIKASLGLSFSGFTLQNFSNSLRTTLAVSNMPLDSEEHSRSRMD